MLLRIGTSSELFLKTVTKLLVPQKWKISSVAEKIFSLQEGDYHDVS
jgi:hypothetical protein